MDSGYLLYLKDRPDIKYEFNKTSGKSGVTTTTKKHNNARVSLNTFGKFPLVYYSGCMDYVTFDLSTIFIATYNDIGEKMLSARQQADAFIDMTKTNKPIVVENSEGKTYICDVQITSDASPTLYEDDTLEYIEIGVSCTQIQ